MSPVVLKMSAGSSIPFFLPTFTMQTHSCAIVRDFRKMPKAYVIFFLKSILFQLFPAMAEHETQKKRKIFFEKYSRLCDFFGVNLKGEEGFTFSSHSSTWILLGASDKMLRRGIKLLSQHASRMESLRMSEKMAKIAKSHTHNFVHQPRNQCDLVNCLG